MGIRRSGLRIGVVCAAVALITLASCRDATEVTLVLSTNVTCTMLKGTSITVGTAAEVDSKPPLTETDSCLDGSIGTFVLVPSSASDASFAVRILTAVGGQGVATCVAPDYKGCIVARRELSFIPHTSLTLPIQMAAECLNTPCTSANASTLESCSGGTCRSAKVSCASSGTCQTMLSDVPDAASTGDDGPGGLPESDIPDQTGDTTTADVSVDVVSPPLESGPDVTAPEAGGPDVATEATVDATADVGADVGPDVGVDAPRDAPPETTVPPDAAPESGPPEAGGPPFDAGVGVCLANGASSGVACSTGRCAPGQVCCVSWDPAGIGLGTETCTTAAGCNTGAAPGNPTFSSLTCRNQGDCATGICCVVASAVNSGFTSTCAASCPGGATKRQSCQCTGECGAGTCGEKACSGFLMSFCGSVCP